MNTKLVAGIALLLSLLSSACNRRSTLPVVGSPEYRELCSAFYLGLAALQSGEDVNARKGLTRATEIAPGEPAGWVNLGLLQARQQEDDAAYQSFEKARALATESSAIETFLGLVESRRGKIPESLAHYRRAVDLDGSNLRAIYTLAAETERQQTGTSTADSINLLDRILKLRPQSEPVLLDIIRLASKLNDSARLKQALAALGRSANNWSQPGKEHFIRLQHAASQGDLRDAAIQAQFLRNTLLREFTYRRSLEEVRAPASSIGEPFLKFVKLPSPSSEPAPPDIGLRFEQQPLKATGMRDAVWIGSMPLDEDGKPAIVWADSKAIQVEDGATLPLPSPRPASLAIVLGNNAVLGADLNYDFKTDLVVATSVGFRIYQQTTRRQFVDVTQKTKLPASMTHVAYTGAWAIDFDLDGDLDIVLGAPQGDPTVLRNNGDGTFLNVSPFKGVDGLISFTNGDIDADGVPDAALIDRNGKLFVFRNERLGAYSQRDVPAQLRENNAAVAAGDVNGDGFIDFVLLRSDRSIVRLSDISYGKSWDFAEIARGDTKSSNTDGSTSLLLADLDNNGGLDIIAGDQVFLENDHRFATLSSRLPFRCHFVADVNGDGRLDLLALSDAHTAVEFLNRGAKNYKWQVIRTRAATVMGDQRINPFGIGGEIEIRSGLLTQKQIIQSPVLHFGLGNYPGVEFARIVWPNGIIQAEFALQAEQSVLAQQRLKGSCPFLFTWDGERMRFLKDVAPMSAALGAHVDAQSLEPIQQTQQWFKIRGDQLAPRDGYYDLRLTDEYWETYYIDHYSLLVVDHQQDSYVWVDERVAHPPVPLKLAVTAKPKPFLAAKDDQGRDVLAVIQDLDEEYLAGFGVGPYQGMTRDHWVELDLPEEAPSDGPLYLVGDGFIRPWDETITIAHSQGTNRRAEDLRLEVVDHTGRWLTAVDHLGIPAGRLKTVTLEIGNIFRPGAPRKLRLRTNMEVYWDRLAWAKALPDKTVRTQQLTSFQAELRYRGFSLLTQAGPSAPELAHYDSVVRTGPQWRSQEGYFTRYGDVGELLERIDNRIVIANSGDELRMRFRAIPPPPAGWTRDFVFIGDGWIKEGDYNLQHSKTVLPLPYHGLKSYLTPLKSLEEDPAYRLHPSDWQHFHTRYMTAEEFARAMWSRQKPQPSLEGARSQ